MELTYVFCLVTTARARRVCSGHGALGLRLGVRRRAPDSELIHSEQITHLIHPVICAVLPAPMYEPIAECARQLAISAWSVKDLLRQGKLRAKKHGRRTIVEVASRLEYAESLPDAEFAPPRDRSRNSDAAKSMTK